ncbi:hypothetical protein A3C96_03545, partial [Candidatus Uhrbacteria bacterium RIFCSPHIGHO2_02_FULL_60_10]
LDRYSYLPGLSVFTPDPAVFGENFDVVAVFDSGDLQYAGVADLMPRLPGRPKVINLDHHATNRLYGDINVVDTSASSAGEVFYNLLRSAGAEIDADTATCLLTGVTTDTGCYSNGATTSGALKAAADLLLLGGKMAPPINRVLRAQTIGSLRVWGQALARLKSHPETGLASTALFRADCGDVGNFDEHAEGIANFLNGYLNHRAVMVLRELPDGTVKGSLRSVDDETDVSAVSAALGGGGHKKASGFRLPGQIVERAFGWVVEKK